MRSDTRRNFVVGGLLFTAVFAVFAYSKLKNKSCQPTAHTVLALVDFTDPIGDDARAGLKNAIWSAIENAADHSNVVLRPIVGKDVSRKQMTLAASQLCRPEKPSVMSGLSGPTKPLEKQWLAFKDEVCGKPPEGSIDPNAPALACGDARRQGSFFEQQIDKSYTSPIAEQVLDGIRRHLPREVTHWHLIVASDWREYNPPDFDVETRKCNPETNSLALNKLLLVGQAEKLLPGTGDPADNNRVDNILVLRSNMTQDEADCLEALADGFFRLNMASPPPLLTTTRLSVTAK